MESLADEIGPDVAQPERLRTAVAALAQAEVEDDPTLHLGERERFHRARVLRWAHGEALAHLAPDCPTWTTEDYAGAFPRCLSSELDDVERRTRQIRRALAKREGRR